MEQDDIRKKIHAAIAEFYALPQPAPERVVVGWPIFNEQEVFGVVDCLLDGRLSQGERTKAFEQEFAKYVGTEHGIAVNSGSSANLVALNLLMELGELERGDEVIIPSATFATVASPIIQLGLVPVYVDIDPETYNISTAEIRKAISPKTKLIMPVHSLGLPADMPEIQRIAAEHKLRILEDCCEAHGASINGKRVGSFGDIATYSFFVAHNMTTGEGGMIMTNDAKLMAMARSLREFGRLDPSAGRFDFSDDKLKNYDKRYVFTRLGFNVRMTDMAAAFGRVQLRKLDQFNDLRRKTVAYYNSALRPYERWVQLPKEPKGYFHTYYGYPLVIRPDAGFHRLELVQFLEQQGVETRPFMGGSLADQPGFRRDPRRIVGDLPVSTWLRDNAFFIGCHPAITDAQRAQVAKAFAEFFAKR